MCIRDSSRAVFLEGYVTAVVQAVLNLPVLTNQVQQLTGVGSFGRQTGEAIDLLNGYNACHQTGHTTNQLKDLPTSGPVKETGLVGHSGQGALFQTTVGFVDRLGRGRCV